jgi:hypothetical protein
VLGSLQAPHTGQQRLIAVTEDSPAHRLKALRIRAAMGAATPASPGISVTRITHLSASSQPQ